MRNFLDFGFSTTMREFTHYVGSLTFCITPCVSILFSACLKPSLSGAGRFHGGTITGGAVVSTCIL